MASKFQESIVTKAEIFKVRLSANQLTEVIRRDMVQQEVDIPINSKATLTYERDRDGYLEAVIVEYKTEEKPAS